MTIFAHISAPTSVLRFLAAARHHSHSAHCNAPCEERDTPYGLEQIYTSLKANIDATTKFESYSLKGRTVSFDDIAAQQLHVAVPEATTANQWQQIQRAIQYGQSKNV
mgnify:CR=1 FL=1